MAKKPVAKAPPANTRQMFIDYLAREGLKLTQQRLAILDVFLEDGGHYTLEEMYRKVSAVDANVGQATVYRTLRLLVDSGFANEVTFGDGLTRYELNHGQTHHDHLICRECGASVEFLTPELETMLEDVARRHGFLQTSHALNIFGVCETCRKK